jgi:hypothetical protein
MTANHSEIISLVSRLKTDIPSHFVPSVDGTKPSSEMVLSFSFVKGNRGYIEKVVNQINGCYENGWYDACAVMMRRVLETVIIESFEHYNITTKIKNQNGDFLYLSDLISASLNETAWNLGRNTRKSLPKLKAIGDYSAHSRRYIAHRPDIENLIDDFRLTIQEFIFLAKLK